MDARNVILLLYVYTNSGAHPTCNQYVGVLLLAVRWPHCSVRGAIKNWTEVQHLWAWIDLPGLRHGKLFIDRPCKKRADDLLKLSRHQLKMVTVIYTGYAPVRGHLYTVGMFDGDPVCRFCGMETETVQHIICCCKAFARQHYNVFGRLTVEPKYISTASVRDLCLFIRGTGLLKLCWMRYWGCTISLRLRCISWWALRRRTRWPHHDVDHPVPSSTKNECS